MDMKWNKLEDLLLEEDIQNGNPGIEMVEVPDLCHTVILMVLHTFVFTPEA